ncbi:hypothetical protein ACIBCA_01050 [Kitasatospora sp. NPDC051170]|uniref:hypothetical protein n=1 Tax=Kitasatospora sp. NPDC051170 TaxID=3364056 RepID=UPI0037A1ACC5
MTGAEIAVGYVSAWKVRQAKRVAGRADEEVDRTLDAAMDELHGLVSRRLGADPALRRLSEEAERDEIGDRTRQRVRLALEDAVEEDPAFGEALRRAVEQVRTLDHDSRASGGVSAADGGLAVGGNLHVEADHGSFAAAMVQGDVTLGNPSRPGPQRH